MSGVAQDRQALQQAHGNGSQKLVNCAGDNQKYAQSQALKADLVESAPKNQGHIVMKLSGDSIPSQRPSSQSPWKQRKKYDPGSQTRGRDKTRVHPTHGVGETQGTGRSPSNSRLCWNCQEVVTGDHYASTCTKARKKEDPNMPVTPYPRGRSASKERGGATQGGETYRMLRGSFGSKPWTKMAAGTAASAEQTEASPAAAAALAAGETSAAEQSELSSTDAAALAEMEEIESKDEDVLGTRGRRRTRGGKTQGSGRSPSNIRLCWNCEEIVAGDHKASTCDKPKKNDRDEDE